MRRLALLEPGTRVDRYVILDVVGQGGMAVVYRVRHESLGSTHALKVVAVPSRSIMQRLLAEGRAQARVKHRNIVAVNDVIEVDGSPGLVMEYVKGPSLDALLHHVRLDLASLDRVGRALLRGVQAAHEAGLVHRDLKPANILVSLEDDGLVPKVADFGLVKDVAVGSDTRTGSMMGTPNYMSPEQIKDTKSVDHRTDIFALGAILYEVATQKLAFHGSDILDIFNRIDRGVFEPVRELRPDLPDRMVAAIEGALKTDRGARFATTARMLEAWCGDVPDQQIPPIQLPEGTIEWIRSTTIVPSSDGDATPPGAERPGAPGFQKLPTPTSGSSDAGTMAGFFDTAPEAAAPTSIPSLSTAPRGRSPAAILGLLAAVALACAGIGGIGALAGGAGLWVSTSGPPPEPPAPLAKPPTPTPMSAPPPPAPIPVAPAPAEPPPAAPPPVAAPAPPPAPVRHAPPAPVAPAPVPAPVMAPAEPPTEAPVAPAPAPAPAVATTATVVVTGDAKVMLLEAGGAKAVPGSGVAPGTYTVLATFPDNPVPVQVQSGVRLAAGDRIEVACSQQFRRCKVNR